MVDNLFKEKLLINSEAFFIRKITLEDTKQCLNIETAAEKSRSIRSETEFKDILSNYTCYGLFNQQSQMICYVFFSIVLDEAELLDINLLKNKQAHGVGSQFLKTCFSILKKQQVNSIILEVATDNYQAIKAYQKFNYKQVGIRKNYYQNTDGSKTDALVYRIVF